MPACRNQCRRTPVHARMAAHLLPRKPALLRPLARSAASPLQGGANIRRGRPRHNDLDRGCRAEFGGACQRPGQTKHAKKSDEYNVRESDVSSSRTLDAVRVFFRTGRCLYPAGAPQYSRPWNGRTQACLNLCRHPMFDAWALTLQKLGFPCKRRWHFSRGQALPHRPRTGPACSRSPRS